MRGVARERDAPREGRGPVHARPPGGDAVDPDLEVVREFLGEGAPRLGVARGLVAPEGEAGGRVVEVIRVGGAKPAEDVLVRVFGGVGCRAGDVLHGGHPDVALRVEGDECSGGDFAVEEGGGGIEAAGHIEHVVVQVFGRGELGADEEGARVRCGAVAAY